MVVVPNTVLVVVTVVTVVVSVLVYVTVVVTTGQHAHSRAYIPFWAKRTSKNFHVVKSTKDVSFSHVK